MKLPTCIILLACLAAAGKDATAKKASDYDLDSVACCAYGHLQAIVWSGSDPQMSIAELAAYCAPILWFSPDEPLLEDKSGADIRMPAVFPFETAPDAPVVYYRLRTLRYRGESASESFLPDATDRGRARLDLREIASFDLDFFFYYPSEEGFGGHEHDVELTEMKVAVWRRPGCDACPYSLIIARVNAKAHGVSWYDNTIDVDEYTKFPITLLVEEGKHASCTDKNGDGYFTPGYDVNRRVNDAWGVRDVIRGGGLFSGGFESWFAKVREPQHRIFPPLPTDSPLRPRLSTDGEYARGYAQYELRPFPRPQLAAHDPKLLPFIADKGSPDWPEVDRYSDLDQFQSWLESESFVKSLALSFRADGDVGLSLTFPLFIVKNFSDPMAGGWIVNRIHLMDKELRDFGYNLLYTTSASRWIDGYFSVGVEWDEDDRGNTNADWVAETGFKFRANVKHSRLSFLSKLTDFWGLRGGLKYVGLLPVTDLGFAIEIGAGTW